MENYEFDDMNSSKTKLNMIVPKFVKGSSQELELDESLD